MTLKWRGNISSSYRTATFVEFLFCVHLVCTCRISGAKVQLFAYNKFGQKINSAFHVWILQRKCWIYIYI